MSQENVEIMRSAYAALAEQGVEAVLPFTDPQFEGSTPSSLASEPDTYRGHEGVRRYFGSFGDAMVGVFLVWTLRQGLVTGVETFAEQAQALEAAGLQD
jgi:hypothetical protein